MSSLQTHIKKLPKYANLICSLSDKVDALIKNSAFSPEIVVANYDELQQIEPSDFFELALVLNSQGISWLPGSMGGDYYPEGIYYHNGIKWVHHKTPYQATQEEVDEGLNNSKFVTPLTLSSNLESIKNKLNELASVRWQDVVIEGKVVGETITQTAQVLEYIYNGNTYYRSITIAVDANGYPVEDIIYTDIGLTNKIAER